MIIVNLKGGLGNQMFQYACGRALSLRTDDPEFKLNTAGLDKANKVGDIHRPYSLSHFNISANIATEEEVRKIANPYGIFSKVLRYLKSKYLYDFYIRFFPAVLSLKGNVYLDGYFQSEKYFSDFKEEIRNDLKPQSISSNAREWTRSIESNNLAVSIHVRRQDYVGHKSLGGICTKEYYNRAIDYVTQLLVQPQFFIFSDDIEWVKSNLNLPDTVKYVSSKKLADYEELVIMSTCRHNIIANSSFSWWAAWLNNYEDKIVIAPRQWAHGKAGKISFRDIIPEGWIKI
jgi:hypothetical protein